MLNEDQVKALVEAITNALPKGEVLHAMTMVPRVGFGDTEAKPVMAFVLTQTAEDFERFRQVVSRGQAEYANEYGLGAAVLRQMDLSDARPAAPVISQMTSDWANPESSGGHDK